MELRNITKIDLNKNKHVSEGCFGEVIDIENGKKVIKLFFSSNQDQERRREIFLSEVHAYEIAINIPELKAITPEFFGVTTVSKISDAEGIDITSQYITDCAYIMSYEKGNFVKLFNEPGLEEEQKRIRLLFQEYKINHIQDVSVILNEQRKVVMVIDFAIQEYPGWY